MADYFVHCYRKREQDVRSTGNVRWTKKTFPESAVENLTIRTQYIPLYRIHRKRYFQYDTHYPKNWQSSTHKTFRPERYSPPGTEGFYFGLTLEGAEDEMRYYGGGKLDPKQDMILVVYCCLDNILHLPMGLHAVWEAAGLPPVRPGEMYPKIMDPDTNNETTNAIGRWARGSGFDGLIYPTARYDQKDWVKAWQEKGMQIVPAINFVDVGSHLCGIATALPFSTHMLLDQIRLHGGPDQCRPVPAELNLVHSLVRKYPVRSVA